MGKHGLRMDVLAFYKIYKFENFQTAGTAPLASLLHSPMVDKYRCVCVGGVGTPDEAMHVLDLLDWLLGVINESYNENNFILPVVVSFINAVT